MKFNIGDLVKYLNVRVKLIQIVYIKGRQRLYFMYPTAHGIRWKSAWNTEVR